MHNKTLLLISFFGLAIVAPKFSRAQTPLIEALTARVENAAKDKKLDAIFELCKEQSSLNPDVLYHYALAAKQMAQSQHDRLKVCLAEYYIASHFSTKGASDSALRIADEQMPSLHYGGKETETYVDFALLSARALNNLNRSKDGFKLLYPLLSDAEKNDDTLTMIRTLNGMAAGFVSVNDEAQANQSCARALFLTSETANRRILEALNITLSNLGLINLHLFESSGNKKFLDSAITYTSQSIAVSRKNDFLGGLGYALGLQGTILGYQQEKVKGEELLKESLQINRTIGNNFYTINTMSIMGNFYGITNQPQKGIAICLEGIELSKASQMNIYLYINLAGNYKLAGDFKKYSEVLENVAVINDSLHKKNSAGAIAEIQARYDLQKKENTIISQNYALAKKNYLAYGAFFLLLVSTLFSLILFRQKRKKELLKLEVLQKEEMRRSEIAVSTAEENERRRIAADLHDNLGGQLSYISSNMDFILEAPLQLSESEKTSHLEKINQTAKSTIADLRESIWALKKQQVELDELADKLKLYLQNHLAHQPFMEHEVNENIEVNPVLSSAEALNVFRIIQESITNASKYSLASTIKLKIESSERVFYKISLEDNGKGFDPLVVKDGHYGLENMRERAAKIGARLIIFSGGEKGTIVTLEKLHNL